MYLFDAHTHLNSEQLFDKRSNHVQDFIDAGWVGLTNIWVNHEYNIRGIKIAQESHTKFPSTYVKCTLWLHPYEISIGNITSDNKDEKFAEMKQLYTEQTKNHIVAIGEIGIDIHYPWSETTLDLQKELFWLQCERARELKLPIVIHSRDAREATHEVLQNFKDLTIYFHCRPYDVEQIKIIKETYSHFYIWFCGNISYPKAQNIRKSLWYLVYENEDYPQDILSWKITNNSRQSSINKPLSEYMNLDNLLIETDAPYLAPQSYRGQINTPAFVKENYLYISQLLEKDISKEVLANNKRVYQLQ